MIVTIPIIIDITSLITVGLTVGKTMGEGSYHMPQ